MDKESGETGRMEAPLLILGAQDSGAGIGVTAGGGTTATGSLDVLALAEPAIRPSSLLLFRTRRHAGHTLRGKVAGTAELVST